MKNILVIDDEPVVGKVIAKALRGICHTEVYTTAEAGLQAARSHKFDLAFLDIKLADRDGFETSSQLKAFQPALEVVFMTGYLNPNLEKQARELKAFGFLQKPFHIKEVREIVNRLIT